MLDRDIYAAWSYLLALVAAFTAALATLLVPDAVASAVGADGLDAVRLVSALGLIGLLAVASWASERTPQERR